MKEILGFSVSILALFVFSESSYSALVVRGVGTIKVGGSGSYRLIYDNLLNVTWLDYTRTHDAWEVQAAWVADLEVSFGGQIYDNWRFPQTRPVNGSSFRYEWRYDGAADLGYNISAPNTIYAGSTGSEMAHLYYTTLGNLGWFPIDYPKSPFPQPGWGLENTGPFKNLMAEFYWSGTQPCSTSDSQATWEFAAGFGYQFVTDECYSNASAIAVLPGDVAIVPVPAAVWLLGGGLIGLVGLRRRYKK